MKWYKRLFWKIFAIIWSISLLVLTIIFIMVQILTEKSWQTDLITAKAEGYAQIMIERYERNNFTPLKPKEHKRYLAGTAGDHNHREFELDPHWRGGIERQIQILDSTYNQQVILKPPLICSDKTIKFELTTSKGHSYEVAINPAQKPPLSHYLIKAILSVQIILILIISALGALLISFFIVGPLKQLSTHARALSQGELSSRTNNRLRRRGDELGELAREFDQMADYVQQTILSQQRLMQDVSHELRAPLARLQAIAGIAEQQWGTEHPIVSRIFKENQRLDQLISEILSFSRLEQMQTQGEAFYCSELLNSLKEDIKLTEPQRDIHLSIESNCQLNLNKALLERALNNILGNACRYTPKDSPIRIQLSQTVEQIHIYIRDYGEGVKDESLEHLCTPFYRGNSSTTGYGLGLSIAKRAIERLGGKLNLSNHPEGGLQAKISLPASG